MTTWLRFTTKPLTVRVAMIDLTGELAVDFDLEGPDLDEVAVTFGHTFHVGGPEIAPRLILPRPMFERLFKPALDNRADATAKFLAELDALLSGASSSEAVRIMLEISKRANDAGINTLFENGQKDKRARRDMTPRTADYEQPDVLKAGRRWLQAIDERQLTVWRSYLPAPLLEQLDAVVEHKRNEAADPLLDETIQAIVEQLYETIRKPPLAVMEFEVGLELRAADLESAELFAEVIIALAGAVEKRVCRPIPKLEVVE